ncbi:hypothetical protein [Streptomyces sp. LN245]|uniref:hypothetical protein n=1 Tax=Streptomyces sp. LN245 TaxID=3112975 RepID=UPI00370FA0F3
MLTLKIQQMTVDGHPCLCPDCASQAFTLDGQGFIDAFPVWGNCWNGHSWEDPLITIGHLKQIQAASTGRAKAEDDDTFEIVIGGAVFAGILHPELTADDLKVAGKTVWNRIIKPAARRKKRAAIRAVKRPVRNAVAAAQAAAIGAAWGLQAGGHQPDPDYTPEPVNACPFCTDGYINLDSHLHDATRIRCSVCTGTGEID